ncbi:MAG: hypothetical protein ABIL76_01455 [candidate division WOR-3 bacterium]
MLNEEFRSFLERLKILISKNSKLIKITLSNVFTLRIIGNKTHGDLAEIALVEFINQYMYDYKAEHIGKKKFRSKEAEEDILVINEVNKMQFLVSIKAYGHGPLQLSTDKEFKMFPKLDNLFKQKGTDILRGNKEIRRILESEEFKHLAHLNVLPLIYDEENKRCAIMVFDFERLLNDVEIIKLERGEGKRKYPVFRFYNSDENYICEVRYGGKDANALQRGFWTHTQKAENYFQNITGWIDYSDNEELIKLISYSLVSSQEGHKNAIRFLLEDINKLKIIQT